MTADMIILTPRISEKTYALSQDTTYVFAVPLNTSKQQIAEAVAKQYGVEVDTVRTIISKGKTKRTARKGGAQVSTGTRKNIKKAYVTLKEGSKIKIFEEEQ